MELTEQEKPVQLRNGHTCDTALKALEDLTAQGLNDLQNAMPAPRVTPLPQIKREVAAMVPRYDEWTGKAAAQLRQVFADPAVAGRLRGERYQYVLTAAPDPHRLPALLNAEFTELRTFFMELSNALREQKARHAGHRGKTLVLDTNDLLHYQRFDKIPWQKQYGLGATVVIPHVIVDEIDVKAFAESDKIRRRARGVFKLLEEVLNAADSDGWSSLPDGTALRILIDEPGHRRLPNNDDEAVARAADLQQAVAPHKVLVLTRDNGVRARALGWGLEAGKLPDKYLIPEDKLSDADLTRDLESITIDTDH